MKSEEQKIKTKTNFSIQSSLSCGESGGRGLEKIENGWAGKEKDGYNCFGCAPGNPSGLQMEFYRDGDELVSFWEPRENFQSWLDVVHGGIQCTMIDEIGGWTVNSELDTCGVTAKMETKFLKPLLFSDGKIEVRAKMMKVNKKLAVIHAWILNGKGETCTEGDLLYYIYPQEIAVEKFFYKPKKTCCNH